MNLHPLVVHFPVALRFIYCLILIVQLFRWQHNTQVNTIKYFCLIIGTLGGFVALQTGENAIDIYGKSSLTHTHEAWAEATYKLFIVASIITIYTLQSRTNRFEWDKMIKTLLTRLINHKLMALVGIAGIIMLTVVGALGGAISRGTNVGDPVSDLVVELLVK